MNEGRRAIRITANLVKSKTPKVVAALLESGARDITILGSRAPVMEERSGILGLFPHTVLVDDPSDTLFIIVKEECEKATMNLIAKTAQLEKPGAGTVFSEHVEIMAVHNAFEESTVEYPEDPNLALNERITGICCIVQRGNGNAVARVSLETGTAVPFVNFGIGTGVRDKMGLLRITIPPEKELITLPADTSDAGLIMNMMIKTGRPDEPGSGFIYTYPLRYGIVNLRVSRGVQKHAATMEQVIAALDEIRGTHEWRGRADQPGSGKKRQYLEGLVEMTLVVNEGSGQRLVEVAMDHGAGGASIRRVKRVKNENSDSGNNITPARESCAMIVGKDKVKSITEGLESADAFGKDAHGQLVTRTVTNAFTYIAPK